MSGVENEVVGRLFLGGGWSAWVWMLIGTVLLVASAGSIVWSQHGQIAASERAPRPDVRYVTDWSRDSNIRNVMGAETVVSTANVATEALTTLQAINAGDRRRGPFANFTVAHFQGLTFVNARVSEHPPKDAARVSARLRFYRDGQEHLHVPVARWPKNAERHQVAADVDIETAPMPTGIDSDVDVLYREHGDAVAYAWTNSGPIRRAPFRPGSYTLHVQLESADFADAYDKRFAIEVPNDPASPVVFTEL